MGMHFRRALFLSPAALWFTSALALLAGCQRPEGAGPVIVPAVEAEGSRDVVRGLEWPIEKAAEHPAVKELGIPLYPGGRPDMIDHWIQERNGVRAVTQVVLRTPDPLDQVSAFYLKELPEARRYEPTRLAGEEGEGAAIVFGDAGARKVIHIWRGAGARETEISAHWLKDCDMRSPEWGE
jgi:hypothetical protein